MGGNKMRCWYFSFGLLIILIFSIISMPIDAEEEPNDSLDQPQSIYEGEVTGNVTSTSNVTDMDIFKLTAHPDSVVFILYKKIDLKAGEITFQYFDSFQSAISEYSFDDHFTLTTPGEMKRDSFTNLDTEDSMFIKVEGNGRYSINVHIIPLPEKDPPNRRSYTVELQEDHADGMVYRMEWEDIVLNDMDLYYFETNSRSIKVTLSKKDTNEGTIKMILDQDSYFIDDSENYIEVSNDHPRDSIDYTMDYWYSGVYIMISGEGNYSLSIDEEIDFTLYSLLGGTILIMLCLMFSPIMIIILVIIVILIGTKKKKNTPTNGQTQQFVNSPSHDFTPPIDRVPK